MTSCGDIPQGGGGGIAKLIIKLNIERLLELRQGSPLSYPLPDQIKRIAIIDDDKTSCSLSSRLVSTFIKKIGGKSSICQLTTLSKLSLPTQDDIIIITANSLAEIEQAPQAIIRHQIDLVFTDFNMPGINGGALTAQIRKAEHPALIIGLTGNPDNFEAFAQAGADYSFAKPFDFLVEMPRLLISG
ncbi:MAG: response regulator [Candidatus Margulisbacteria bacterium]|nr:response regulator [Candidatus Margulisiibacteriota bacterium]